MIKVTPHIPLSQRIIYKDLIEDKVDRSDSLGNSYRYKMIDARSRSVLGEMITTEYPDYLYIDSLKANVRKQGIGKTLVNIAKKESREAGYDGKLRLISSCVLDSKNPPHVFYRKQGFSTSSKFLNMILDFCSTFHLKGRLLKKNINMFI